MRKNSWRYEEDKRLCETFAEGLPWSQIKEIVAPRTEKAARYRVTFLRVAGVFTEEPFPSEGKWEILCWRHQRRLRPTRIRI